MPLNFNVSEMCKYANRLFYLDPGPMGGKIRQKGGAMYLNIQNGFRVCPSESNEKKALQVTLCQFIVSGYVLEYSYLLLTMSSDRL